MIMRENGINDHTFLEEKKKSGKVTKGPKEEEERGN